MATLEELLKNSSPSVNLDDLMESARQSDLKKGANPDQIRKFLERQAKTKSLNSPDVSKSAQNVEPVAEPSVEIPSAASELPKFSEASIKPKLNPFDQKWEDLSNRFKQFTGNPSEKLNALLDSVKNSKYAQAAQDFASSDIGQAAGKIAGKGLLGATAIAQGLEAKQQYDKGDYLGSGLSGAGSAGSIAALAGVAPTAGILAGLPAASYGLGKELGKLSKESIESNPNIIRDKDGNVISNYGLDYMNNNKDNILPEDLSKLDALNKEEKIRNVNPMSPEEAKVFENQLKGSQEPNASELVKESDEKQPPESKLPISSEDEEETEGSPTARGISEKNGISEIEKQKPLTKEDLLGGNSGISQQIADALRQTKENQKNAELFRALAGVASATAGMSSKVAAKNESDKFFEDLMKSAGSPLEEIQNKYNLDKLDPNSPISKSIRSLAQANLQKAGLNVDLSGVPGSDIEKMESAISSAASRQAALQAHSDDMRYKMEYLKAQKEMLGSEKQQKLFQDQKNKTIQMLESAKGNPAVGQAEKDIYSADKALSLSSLYSDPNKLSPQMVTLLSSEVAKIAQGGVPTIAEMQALDQKTLASKFASITQTFTNKPTAANAREFIKQYTDYAKSLRNDAQKVISDKYGRVIESNKKYLNPDDYNILRENYINRFKPAISEDDKEAIKWANENPNDPRSQQILKLHGM